MSPILSRIYQSEGGTEALDVLMKYLYAVPIIAHMGRFLVILLSIPPFGPERLFAVRRVSYSAVLQLA
jgi:hypothetical protein